MATLKLVLYKYTPLKNGGYKIKVALSHKQETCYFSTRFVVDSEKQWSNGAVVRRPDASIINTKLRGLLDKYQNVLDTIQNQGLCDCKQLKKIIESKLNGEDKKSFLDVSYIYIHEITKENRNRYASLITLSVRYFELFSSSNLLLQDITPQVIIEFNKWLHENTNANNTTITKYLSHIKVILNYAIKCQYVSYPIHPFSQMPLQRSKSREEDISFESLTKIKNAELSSRLLIITRDLFMLSFYLGGINLIDLISSDFSNGDEVTYIRTKTRRRSETKVVLPIVPEAKDIIDKWLNPNTGKLDFGYKFDYKNFCCYIGKGMRKLKETLGIKETLVFYSARNTFSQFASDLGIPNAVIDYCLGHSASSQGVISYYIKVKKQQAASAIERVVDYINNPEAYKDYLKFRQEIAMTKF